MDQARRSAADQLTFDLGPRQAWAGLTIGLTLLAVTEILGLASIAHALLPAPLAYVVILLIVLPTVSVVIVVGSALTGRVTVDAEQLRLRFGLLGGTRVPRAHITRAERFVPPLIRPVGLGIDVPHGTRQATVSRGGEVPYVRVLLNQPAIVRTALWRRAPANELVLGTGMPDQLVAALV